MTTSTTGNTIDPAGVDHPAHYNLHPSGIEAIQVMRHMDVLLGTAFKYVMRAGLKHEGDTKQSKLKDLHKALWYVADRINNWDTFSGVAVPGSIGALCGSILAHEPDPLVGDIICHLHYGSQGAWESATKAHDLILQLIARTKVEPAVDKPAWDI